MVVSVYKTNNFVKYGKRNKENRNAKQGIDTMGVSTSEIAKEISKPQTAMPIYESMMMK